MDVEDIRAVVAIGKCENKNKLELDFGTTYSGFAYAHRANPEIETNGRWPGREGLPKTNTALRYEYDPETGSLSIAAWGEPALVQTPEKKKKANAGKKEIYSVELFKLHLTEMSNKPSLPAGMNYKKPICDYLSCMNKLIKETIEKTWPGMRSSQILYVMTIPAEWKENTKVIMRECAHAAGIIETADSKRLEFTSEPEAAAMHCLNVVEEHKLKTGDSFLVVDCGGGTVDLTTRTINNNNKLGEITERTGDLCGATFIDLEFLKYLGKLLGFSALEKVKTEHYGQLQYLIQKFFCPRVKYMFDGNADTFKPIDLDLEHYCPALMKYVTGENKEKMEQEDWLIELDFESVKSMFDPVVAKVIKLISNQLKAAESVKSPSAMFLVGGFSESVYLRNRIKESFASKVPIIAEPRQPMGAVLKGAVAYGLNMEAVETRILKWSYGIEVLVEWDPSEDPFERRTFEGRVHRFQKLAERRTQVKVDKEFSGEFKPVYPDQTSASFKVYYSENSPRYCDEPGVCFLGKLQIDLPDTYLGINRPIEFSLTFGKMELKASAHNKTTGQMYHTSWTMNNFVN
ncbi:11419_t:CDS:10 [Ambispora leptoticha]|uniref:11419_t:CDS:1 n=1 Tax=Ambispora leptoticha TaxID=144679 RepID=A0A9N8WMK6_9GLOM|nr:11419_t:CDS:10 [Ambispora leptoticha]